MAVQKALDLLRDPRCIVHSTVSDKDGSEDEFKIYGRAVDINDSGMRRRFADALYEKIGFRPEEPEYHRFSIGIESAAYAVIQDDEWVRKLWKGG